MYELRLQRANVSLPHPLLVTKVYIEHLESRGGNIRTEDVQTAAPTRECLPPSTTPCYQSLHRTPGKYRYNISEQKMYKLRLQHANFSLPHPLLVTKVYIEHLESRGGNIRSEDVQTAAPTCEYEYQNRRCTNCGSNGRMSPSLIHSLLPKST